MCFIQTIILLIEQNSINKYRGMHVYSILFSFYIFCLHCFIVIKVLIILVVINIMHQVMQATMIKGKVDNNSRIRSCSLFLIITPLLEVFKLIHQQAASNYNNMQIISQQLLLHTQNLISYNDKIFNKHTRGLNIYYSL